METGARVLLTGATGFVGQTLLPALADAGYLVRGATRRPKAAAARQPQYEWVELDVDRPQTLEPALTGCEAAVYLVHSIGGDDYAQRERRAAEAFRSAAERCGVRRVVYLGGVAPRGAPSRHLASRLAVGEALRSGGLEAIELRAAMIIGAGSVSWQVVRGLAARLPAMVLPRWLSNHSWPVSIHDVVRALVGALQLPPGPSRWYDVPGPERISHRDMLVRTARHLGKEPWTLGVPVLTPRLSSYWITGVTGVPLVMVQELVAGLTSDLDPSGPSIWEDVPGGPRSLDAAISEALADERVAAAARGEALTLGR